MKTLIASIVACVTATVYNAVPGQTDETPNITATGFVIDLDAAEKHRIVAVSRDLEKIGFTMGKTICVENAGPMNGIWYIRDRMNKRWTKKIDFLVNKKVKYGKWNNVSIRLINSHNVTIGS